MTPHRTFMEHELERLRQGTGHHAIGGDDALIEPAALDEPTPEEYLVALAAVQHRPEFAEIGREFLERQDFDWLRAERGRRWTAYNDALATAAYKPEEDAALAGHLLPLWCRALAADAVFARYLPDWPQRIERLQSPVMAARRRDAYIDLVIERSIGTSPRATALRATLIAARDKGSEYGDTCDRLVAVIGGDPDLAQAILDTVLADDVIVPGSIRRALVNLPSLLVYLEGARRNERFSAWRRTHIYRDGSAIEREIEIERAPDLAAADDTAAIAIERVAFGDLAGRLAPFVKSLPPATHDRTGLGNRWAFVP